MPGKKLRTDGIFPTEVVEEKAQKGRLSGDLSFQSLFQKIGLREVSVATRQLATLLKAGLPLVIVAMLMGLDRAMRATPQEAATPRIRV